MFLSKMMNRCATISFTRETPLLGVGYLIFDKVTVLHSSIPTTIATKPVHTIFINHDSTHQR
jgi:hypothetical protein